MAAHASRNPALAALLVGATCLASTSAVSAQPNDAEPATRRANAEVLRSLPFGDRVDFDEAQRGFIAELPSAIMSADGQRTIWSMQPYAFETGEAPATVNPSLWRQAYFDTFPGLFRETVRFYP